ALQLIARFDDAIALYQKILARKPDSEECLTNLISIATARKDFKLVRDCSEKLLAVRPTAQAALEGLAACAFGDNDFEAAAVFSEKLVESKPDSFERWFNLGVAYHKLAKLPEAAKA